MLRQHVFVNPEPVRGTARAGQWYSFVIEHLEGNKQGVTCLFCEMDSGKRATGSFFGGYTVCDKHESYEDHMNKLIAGVILGG